MTLGVLPTAAMNHPSTRIFEGIPLRWVRKGVPTKKTPHKSGVKAFFRETNCSQGLDKGLFLGRVGEVG